jgi:phage baseplate assembly protein W
MSKISSAKEALEIRLGADAAFPIQGNFKPVKGIELLLQDIQRLLLTIPGERPNRPQFGCTLRNQIWENLDTAAHNGKASIREAIERFEPRINLTGISSIVNQNTGLITFNIQFLIIQDDTPVNLIFPFRAGTSLSFS